MADRIKAFFDKRKGKGKFTGKGHKLTEAAPKPSQADEPVQGRSSPTEDAKRAGEAAVARLSQKIPAASFSNSFGPRPSKTEDTESLAVQGVYFKCPLISPEVLSKDEWKVKIRSFLQEQLSSEPALTSCLIIRTLNKNKDEVSTCVDTLATYLRNIKDHPDEEKYRKIRLTNKIFTEKVSKLEGSLDFLKAVGFQVQTLPFKEAEEEFLVYDKQVDSDELEMHIDSLYSAEPVPLELDRNVQVLKPEVAATKVDLPDDFFRLTVEDLKREQIARRERIENMMQLKTKVMREKEAQREMKKYRYTVIRVRLPDGVLLQGTFNVYEKVKAVKAFVVDHLVDPSVPFDLKTPLGVPLSASDDETLLLDLKLVPAVLLNITGSIPGPPYLNAEAMQLLQSF